MKLSLSWETVNLAATQEFTNIFWKAMVHYRVHTNPLLVPILSQINPVHTTLSYLSKIHLTIILPPTFKSFWRSLSFWLSHQKPTQSFSHHACYMPWPSHPPWLDHSNNTWRRVKVINLSIMLSLPNAYPSLFSPITLTYISQRNIVGIYGVVSFNSG
jgi:hypothetical protein